MSLLDDQKPVTQEKVSNEQETPLLSLYDLFDVSNTTRINEMKLKRCSADDTLYRKAEKVRREIEESENVNKRKRDETPESNKRTKGENDRFTLSCIRLLDQGKNFDHMRNHIDNWPLLRCSSLVRNYYRFFPIDMSNMLNGGDLIKIILSIKDIKGCENVEGNGSDFVKSQARRIYSLIKKEDVDNTEIPLSLSPESAESNVSKKKKDLIESIKNRRDLNDAEIEQVEEGMHVYVKEIIDHSYSYEFYRNITSFQWLKKNTTSSIPDRIEKMLKFIQDYRFDSPNDPQIPFKEILLVILLAHRKIIARLYEKMNESLSRTFLKNDLKHDDLERLIPFTSLMFRIGVFEGLYSHECFIPSTEEFRIINDGFTSFHRANSDLYHKMNREDREFFDSQLITQNHDSLKSTLLFDSRAYLFECRRLGSISEKFNYTELEYFTNRLNIKGKNALVNSLMNYYLFDKQDMRFCDRYPIAIIKQFGSIYQKLGKNEKFGTIVQRLYMSVVLSMCKDVWFIPDEVSHLVAGSCDRKDLFSLTRSESPDMRNHSFIVAINIAKAIKVCMEDALHSDTSNINQTILIEKANIMTLALHHIVDNYRGFQEIDHQSILSKLAFDIYEMSVSKRDDGSRMFDPRRECSTCSSLLHTYFMSDHDIVNPVVRETNSIRRMINLKALEDLSDDDEDENEEDIVVHSDEELISY